MARVHFCSPAQSGTDAAPTHKQKSHNLFGGGEARPKMLSIYQVGTVFAMN